MGVASRIEQIESLASRATNRIALLHARRHRIGYVGWQGQGNLGDEVMFQAARVALSPYRISPYGGVQKERALATLGLSGSTYFQSVVLGGGTLINPYYAPFVQLALAQGIPVWSFGTGVGSSGFEDPHHVNLSDWPDLLRRFACIGVRGPLSKEKLEAIGVGRVEVIGDLAMSLARPTSPTPTSRPRVALNIALPLDNARSSGLDECLHALELTLSSAMARGWELVPVAMTTHDVAVLRRFLTGVAGAPTTIYEPRMADDFFHIVGSCTFTIAVRLHTAILSSCVGVPPLLIGYRDKCLDFMRSMDLEEWYIDPHTVRTAQIAERVQLLSNDASSLRPYVLQQAQRWKSIQHAFVQRVLDTA